MKTSDLLTLLASIIFSLIIMEIGLRTFTPYPINQASNKVKHEALGYVLDSGMDEIDEHGFRNDPLPSIDVITIGDSHTYGINATSDDSWPKQLGRMSNSNVYNFGMSGYGILQYKYLLDKAIELQPKMILLGLYLTNDLNDICKPTLRNQYWKSRTKQFNFDSSLCPEKKAKRSAKGSTHKKSNGEILFSWLTDNIAIFSMASRYYEDYSAVNTIEKGEIEDSIVVNDAKIKTIFNLERIREHVTYTDLRRPHIQIAIQALKKILTNASSDASSKDIRFAIILIPSKERVFYNYLTRMDYVLPENYNELVKNEDALKNNMSVFLENTDIPFIDVLPDMENALLENENIYPANDNGHPINTGYRIYAKDAFKLYQQINE